MSHCLSNLSISHPISSRFSHSLCPPISGRICPKITAKASAADGRENLDHLQRQNKQQQQLQQPKKRAAPVAPIGMVIISRKYLFKFCGRVYAAPNEILSICSLLVCLHCSLCLSFVHVATYKYSI